MANLLVTIVFGMAASTSPVLVEEFGIYMDNMPTTSPADRAGSKIEPERQIYQKYAPSGSLPSISPQNFKGPVQSNSRFDRANSPRGTTLGGRNFRPSPLAPSRFNRPGFK